MSEKLSRNVKEVETWLPLFPGFYETWLSYDEYSEAESLLYYDPFMDRFTKKEQEELNTDVIIEALVQAVDYRQYEEDVARAVTDYVMNGFEEAFKGVFVKHEFQELISPREYNFQTDSINLKVWVNTQKLHGLIYDEWREDLVDYLKDHYTPRDGFLPFYSKHIENWEEDTKGFTDFSVNGHYLGAILDMVLEHGLMPEGDDLTFEGMYDYVFGDAEIYLSSYYDLDKLVEFTKQELKEERKRAEESKKEKTK